MTSESLLLEAKIEAAAPALAAASLRLWRRPDRALYREFLTLCHMALRATTPLLECALAECLRLGPGDPVATRLVGYYREQLAEESGHDRALLEDYAAAGGDPHELLGWIPPPEIAALVGAQYYWVRHGHPAALVGHIAVLEGHPPSPPLLARIKRGTGLPPGAFRTLDAHAALDREHRTALAAVLDSLPLQPCHRGAIGVAALHSMKMLVATLDRLSHRTSGEDG